MMGQRYRPGVTHALVNRKPDGPKADVFDDDGLRGFSEDDGVDGVESIQRKRRHRIGSKPPWLKHRGHDERLDH